MTHQILTTELKQLEYNNSKVEFNHRQINMIIHESIQKTPLKINF